MITWTSNIQGWTAHGWHEFSSQMQVVEIYSPIAVKASGAFVGVHHEAIFYDPEAFVKPVRVVEYLERDRALNEGTPFEWRECIQTLFPIEGLQTAVTPGQVIEYSIHDMYNRPWAEIWERYFEEGMQRPTDEPALFGF